MLGNKSQRKRSTVTYTSWKYDAPDAIQSIDDETGLPIRARTKARRIEQVLRQQEGENFARHNATLGEVTSSLGQPQWRTGSQAGFEVHIKCRRVLEGCATKNAARVRRSHCVRRRAVYSSQDKKQQTALLTCGAIR